MFFSPHSVYSFYPRFFRLIFEFLSVFFCTTLVVFIHVSVEATVYPTFFNMLLYSVFIYSLLYRCTAAKLL